MANLESGIVAGVYNRGLDLDGIFGLPILKSGNTYMIAEHTPENIRTMTEGSKVVQKPATANSPAHSHVDMPGPHPHWTIGKLTPMKKVPNMYPYHSGAVYRVGDPMVYAFIVNPADLIVGPMSSVASILESRLSDFSGDGFAHRREEIIEFINRSKVS